MHYGRPVTAPTPSRRLGAVTGANAIYGLIVVAAVLAAATDDDPDIEVFRTAVVTLIGVWIAHVFATVIASPTSAPGVRGVLAAVRHSLGLVLAPLIPLVILLAGAIDPAIEDAAYWTAVVVSLVLLAVAAWVGFARRGSGLRSRIVGSLVTALAGVVVVIIKAALH